MPLAKLEAPGRCLFLCCHPAPPVLVGDNNGGRATIDGRQQILPALYVLVAEEGTIRSISRFLRMGHRSKTLPHDVDSEKKQTIGKLVLVGDPSHRTSSH